MRVTSRSVAAAVGVAVASSVLLAGCGGSDQGAPEASASSPQVIEIPSDAPFTDPSLPSPAATLTAPAVPAGEGVATAAPTAVAQFVPPDIGLSGIAIAVSSTQAAANQKVEVAAQGAPELAGHVAYLTTGLDAGAATLATTTVGVGGAFQMGFAPSTTTPIVVVIAQSDVTPGAPFNPEQVVARSEVVTITVNP